MLFCVLLFIARTIQTTLLNNLGNILSPWEGRGNEQLRIIWKLSICSKESFTHTTLCIGFVSLGSCYPFLRLIQWQNNPAFQVRLNQSFPICFSEKQCLSALSSSRTEPPILAALQFFTTIAFEVNTTYPVPVRWPGSLMPRQHPLGVFPVGFLMSC